MCELHLEGYDNEEVIDDTIRCKNNHVWEIKNGVVDFKSQEQLKKNNWSKMYQMYDYKTWDQILLDKLSGQQVFAGNVTHDRIVDTLRESAAKSVLDIGTGRGILLKAMLAANVENIVCIDLSYEVLKCDRVKFLEMFPNAKVNYIACDASRLPFMEQTFDMTVSLAGFTNMHDEVHLALKESIRVSKKGVLSAATVSDCKHIKSVEEERFDMIHRLPYRVCVDTIIKEETFKVLMCEIKPS